ncbi:MAG: gamma carbonic anhydrase family protein [Firmicutes bacterium]|nr:gamma carbonic anhydrase family protein [Bacillota bacterium]
MIIPYGGRTPDTEKAAFVAETAVLTGDVTLQKDSSVWFGAVIRGDGPHIEIGAESNIQDNCVLHADEGFPLTVGAGVTVGHGAILHGCTVGDGSLIGMGAMILNGTVIGKNCIVGAGALVTSGKVFGDGSLILGSPAKAVKQLTPKEIAGIKKSSAHYVEQAKEYAR